MLDEEKRVVDDPGDVDEIAVRARAELAVIRLRGGDDDQLLDASLEQPARIDAVPEPREGGKDLGSKAHRLDHLDRRAATLPEAAALIEGRVVLHGLESGLDLLRRHGHTHRQGTSAGTAIVPLTAGSVRPASAATSTPRLPRGRAPASRAGRSNGRCRSRRTGIDPGDRARRPGMRPGPGPRGPRPRSSRW